MCAERVRLTTIDSLELPVVRLIKIDVNGMELDVLNGMRRFFLSLFLCVYALCVRICCVYM